MTLRTLLAVVSAFISSGCIVIDVDGGDRGPRFGPDDSCPHECVNPFSETCWHDAGGCGHVDSDADGLADDDEARLGTDPEDPDTDGDGVCDGDEIDAGTDPLGSA